jgi:hypothetical protein
MVNRKIIRDVRKILMLARLAHTHLQKNKIPKAKKELARIIKLDMDEMSRLQKEHGDQRLLEECSAVFRDAKKAIRELDSTRLSDEAKKLVDEIVKLEEHELLEIEEEEKEENQLYRYWSTELHAKEVYHGTSSLSLPQMKRYGIAPTMRPAFWADFKRLYHLYKKARNPFPLRVYHGIELGDEMANKMVFLTPIYKLAVQYSKKSPAIWNEFKSNAGGNLKSVQNHAFKSLFLQFQEGLHWDYGPNYRYYKSQGIPKDSVTYAMMKELRSSIRKDFSEIYRKHGRKSTYDVAMDQLHKKYKLKPCEICPLSKSEVNEVLRIFHRLWLVFKDVHPVIIHISIVAPAVAKTRYFAYNKKSWICEFKAFLGKFREFTILISMNWS